MSKTSKIQSIALPSSTWDEICAYLHWAKGESEQWATEEGADDDMDYIREHRDRAHGIEMVLNQLALLTDHSPDIPIIYVAHFEMAYVKWKAIDWVQAYDLWHFEQFAMFSLQLIDPVLMKHIEQHSEEHYVVTTEVNDRYRTTIFHRGIPYTAMTTSQPQQQMSSNGSSVERI